jgi:hypothetical protein
MKKTLLIGIFLAALGCGDGGPLAGDLVFQFGTPNADDGAVQFRIVATTPNTLTGVAAACTGCRVFKEQVSDTEIRGIVVGTLSTGDLLRVSVSDTKTPELYAATVVRVASSSYVVKTGAGYSLVIPVPAN